VIRQDGSNKRTDDSGGSSVNRSRCLREVVQAMVSVWGGDRVAVHIGLSGAFNGMSDSNPGTLFDDVAEQLNRFRLAYLHIIEPGVKGNVLIAEGDYVIVHGRFSGTGRPVAWIAADIVRIENSRLAEHWDVLQDEATQAESKSGLPMFGDRFTA